METAFLQFYGDTRSCCQQKVTGTLRGGINILHTVTLFSHLFSLFSSFK